MIKDRQVGALEARVERLEAIKRRLLARLPLLVALAMVGKNRGERGGVERLEETAVHDRRIESFDRQRFGGFQ